PGNVLVTDQGVAKLTDLGIARWAEETATGDGHVVGTPSYLAPEVADGHLAGPAADVYSLGATLFAAVEGIAPTGGSDQSPFERRRRAATGDREPIGKAGPLGPVLLELLSKDTAQRPTARMAKTLLDGISGGTEPLEPMPRRRSRRRRTVLTVGALSLVVAAV